MSELNCGNGLVNGMTEAQAGTPAATLQVSVLHVGNTGKAPSVCQKSLWTIFPKTWMCSSSLFLKLLNINI